MPEELPLLEWEPIWKANQICTDKNQFINDIMSYNCQERLDYFCKHHLTTLENKALQEAINDGSILNTTKEYGKHPTRSINKKVLQKIRAHAKICHLNEFFDENTQKICENSNFLEDIIFIENNLDLAEKMLQIIKLKPSQDLSIKIADYLLNVSISLQMLKIKHKKHYFWLFQELERRLGVSIQEFKKY